MVEWKSKSIQWSEIKLILVLQNLEKLTSQYLIKNLI